ncbi:MAG: hypothetical protein LBP22_05120 [Deltaproteobacteria bacterium]|jgi:hypothetical protein|nr:hypothetical protein [Deltaproteobacteria bacterium]
MTFKNMGQIFNSQEAYVTAVPALAKRGQAASLWAFFRGILLEKFIDTQLKLHYYLHHSGAS